MRDQWYAGQAEAGREEQEEHQRRGIPAPLSDRVSLQRGRTLRDGHPAASQNHELN